MDVKRETPENPPAPARKSGFKHVTDLIGFIAVLTFIFLLIYLSHNHWHF